MGAAVVGLGIVILFGSVDGLPAHLIDLLFTAARKTLELVAWQALQAYAFDHQRFSPCPLQMLVSFWPPLHALAGAA